MPSYKNQNERKLKEDEANDLVRLEIANNLNSSDAIQKTYRNKKLNIPPPPAQYKTASEELRDTSLQIQKALKTLKLFMLDSDAGVSLNYLQTNNILNEFNKYTPLFLEQIKYLINSKTHISLESFVSLWNNFIDNIKKGIQKKYINEITPREQLDYDLNSELNRINTQLEDSNDYDNITIDDLKYEITNEKKLNKSNLIKNPDYKEQYESIRKKFKIPKKIIKQNLYDIYTNYLTDIKKIIEKSITYSNPTSTSIGGTGLKIKGGHMVNFGRYKLNKNALSKNYLNLRYPSNIDLMKKILISNQLKKILNDIIINNQFNEEDYNELDNKEKKIFDDLILKCKLENTELNKGLINHIKYNDEDNNKIIKEYKLNMGELVAGNNNPEIIKNLRRLLLNMEERDLISKPDFNKTMKYLIFL